MKIRDFEEDYPFILRESEERTVLLDSEDGETVITVEENLETLVCTVKSKGKYYGHLCEIMQSVMCEIHCLSAEEMKRCRKQTVSSLAQNVVRDSARAEAAEDANDFLNLMTGGKGFYHSLPVIDAEGGAQLAELADRCKKLRERFFNCEICGRIMTSGDFNLTEGWPLAQKFISALGLEIKNLIYQNRTTCTDEPGMVDIWVFPK